MHFWGTPFLGKAINGATIYTQPLRLASRVALLSGAPWCTGATGDRGKG